jgi:hypothetical protein
MSAHAAVLALDYIDFAEADIRGHLRYAEQEHTGALLEAALTHVRKAEAILEAAVAEYQFRDVVQVHKEARR